MRYWYARGVNCCVTLLNTHRDQVVSSDNPIFRPIILVPALRKTTPVLDQSCVPIKPTESHHLEKADKLSLRSTSGTLFSPQIHTEILSMFITNVLQTRPNLGGVQPRLLHAPHLLNSQCCHFREDNRCGSHEETLQLFYRFNQ